MYKKFLLIGSGNFVNEIKGMLSGLAVEIEIANEYPEIRPKIKNENIDIIIFDGDSFPLDSISGKNILSLLKNSKIKFVVLSSENTSRTVLTAKEACASDCLLKPYSERELNLSLSAILNDKRKICCIGGGTGLFNLLMGLKHLPGTLLTSIVSMTDSGGSSGRLKDSFGVLPPGDVRKSLVALSNAPQVMNELMTYRFSQGGCLVGHSLGNLLLTALAKIKDSMSDAVSGISDILNIQGIVHPVSPTISTLCAEFDNGVIIKGESNIDLCKGRRPELRIKKCWHEPESKGDINAYSALMNADVVTIGPGDLFTSVITNLLVEDIREAVIKTKAKKSYICNLMTKPGETYGFDAFDHIKEIIKYLKKDCLDYVILSDDESLSMNAVLRYSKKKQFPVKIRDINKIKKITKAKIIIADVSHETELIRHDSSKIAGEIVKIMNEEK